MKKKSPGKKKLKRKAFLGFKAYLYIKFYNKVTKPTPDNDSFRPWSEKGLGLKKT